MTTINYQVINAKATALITSLGFPIVVTRNGVTVGKGNAVVTPSKAEATEGSTSPSPMQIATKTLYVTASAKFAPVAGDLVTSKVGQWQVIGVEDYKPSTVTIAFKLVVQ